MIPQPVQRNKLQHQWEITTSPPKIQNAQITALGASLKFLNANYIILREEHSLDCFLFIVFFFNFCISIIYFNFQRFDFYKK